MRALLVGDFRVQLIEEFLAVCHFLVCASGLIPVNRIQQLGRRLIEIDFFRILHSGRKGRPDLRRENVGIAE